MINVKGYDVIFFIIFLYLFFYGKESANMGIWIMGMIQG